MRCGHARRRLSSLAARSRSPSCCCRSSAIFAHTSPAQARRTSSRTPSSRDAFVVSIKTSVDRAGADPAASGRRRRTCSRRGASRAARSRSRSSSCRSCCRRRSPGSGCSPRSAASACSARASTSSASRCRSRRPRSTVAVAYVASPLYIRQAIAAFEATDPQPCRPRRARSAPGRRARSSASCSRSRAAACSRGSRSRSRAASASSARRSCSRAASRRSRRRCRSRSTRSSTRDFDATLAMSGVLVIVSAVLLLAPQNRTRMATLNLDNVDRPSSVFRARAEPRGRAHGRPRRAVGSGEEHRAATRSPGSCARARGAIGVGGRDVVRRAAGVDLPPERRSVGLVFQDYALFPHLTVRAERRVRAAPRGRRVPRALPHLRTSRTRVPRRSPAASASASRSPARSRATRAVLLLDEPLAALDAHTKTSRCAPSCRSCSRGARASRRCS